MATRDGQTDSARTALPRQCFACQAGVQTVGGASGASPWGVVGLCAERVCSANPTGAQCPHWRPLCVLFPLQVDPSSIVLGLRFRV
jgi:hypothetical protein